MEIPPFSIQAVLVLLHGKVKIVLLHGQNMGSFFVKPLIRGVIALSPILLCKGDERASIQQASSNPAVRFPSVERFPKSATGQS
jgi:hypothetical protein